MSQAKLFTEQLEPRALLANPFAIGGAFYDTASKVVAMPDGGSVVAGLYTETADFNPTSGTFNLTAEEDRANAFIARYSADGRLMWVRSFGNDEGKIKVDDVIDTPVDPERASGFDLGVGVNPADLGIYVTGLAVDASGGIFFTGAFRGSIDFLNGHGQRVLTSAGSDDFLNAYFGKLNSNGGLSFVRQIASPFTTVTNAITLDSSNNIYLTGYFTRSANFNVTGSTHTLSTRGREDIFTAKYDPVGRLKWVNSADTDETNRAKRSAGNALALDSTGNVYLTGTFSGEMRFIPSSRDAATTIDSIDDTDTFVEKLSPAGALVWVKAFGGDHYDGGVALTLSPDNASVYVGSYFEDTIDADPGSAVRQITATPEDPGDSPDRSDLLISKFNSTNGTLAFAGPLVAGPGWETLGQLVTDSSGNIYATGGFYGRADFNPTSATFNLTSAIGIEDFHDQNDSDRDYSYDLYLTKLDANCNLVFAENFGSASDDYGTAIALSASQQPIVAGQFRGTYFFPNSSAKFRPQGGQDAFVAIFGTDGKIL